ncbi:MAG: alpha/beta hydrolase [Pseudomonadota bacterium]|nr:alpha/beta hydrolase [Pseudomonadota bacterium]
MTRLRILISAAIGACALLVGCTGVGALNAITPDRGYTLAEDVVYDGSTNMKLDVYAPTADVVGGAPVVVFFYGGRWQSGSKDDYRFVGQALAAQGYVAVIPDYRLYPDVRFPSFLEDSAKAMRWAHDNASRFRGDAAKLFVMGHSSGAYNAAMLALDPRFLTAVGGSRDWLSGMIGLAGPYDFLPIYDPTLRDIFGPPEKFQDTQPIFHVDGENPPLLLMAGQDDEIVQAENTNSLRRAVVSAGGAVDVVMYPKMSHEKLVSSLATRLQSSTDVMAHVVEFINENTAGR